MYRFNMFIMLHLYITKNNLRQFQGSSNFFYFKRTHIFINLEKPPYTFHTTSMAFELPWDHSYYQKSSNSWYIINCSLTKSQTRHAIILQMYANTVVLNKQKISEYNSIHPFHQSMDSKHKCYVHTMHIFMGAVFENF